ncbi:UNVERIFIED_CONTAM: hypothetical protein Sindi_2320700 [Sesamum indicum]
MAAGDEEDDGDASASDGDIEKVGGRRLVTGDGEDSYHRKTGKTTRLLVQTAPFTGDLQANKSEPMIGETSTLIAHGKRGGLEMEKAAVSAPQLLGFAESSNVEKAAVLAPQLLGIDAPLDTEKEAASAPNLLGFDAPLEPQAVDETEQPRARVYAENEQSPDEYVTSPVSLATDANTTGFAEVGDEGLLRKEATIQASSLGFGEAPSSINGGRRFEPFNLEEFLRLANAVIDKGDEKTIAALRDLKDRWKERFRSIPSLRSFVESRGPPSRSSAIGISAGNATVLPATGERRVPHLADVAIVGNGDGELAAAMADDVEGDVIDDARMTSDDITADITSDDIIAEITTDGITADAGMTASAVDVIDDVTLHKKTRKQFSNFSSFPTGLFVGNIPLHACSNTIINDKIAHAFHNSTRKTLSYVAPTMQNGEEFAMSIWPDLKEVTGTNNGFFFLQFKSVAAMEDVIEGGPWLFQGQPIVLQKWEPGMVLRKLQHTQVPVWIKLRHLPVELWTDKGLSTVASGVGKPLYPDAITRACTRLDFARVCVMLDVTSNLPKHIIIMTPDEDGGESPCKVDVEYEWLPQKCQRCMTMGHSDKECILNKPKPAKPPIAVYVPKMGTPQEPTMPKRSRNHPREEGDTTYKPSRPTNMPDRNMSRPPPARVVEKQREGRESPRDAAGPSREERVWNVRGLNKRDHQLAVKDIVAEFSTQFIHCHVNIRALHESIAIAVIYGANELVERRALWDSMETIAMQSADIPWLVGGDFNTVRDLSEICYHGGDIRMAMEDFNTCIQNTGLLPLPMQGEWYTWHNCSAGPRNLWKRLDRMLINDRWMAQFPTSYYSSLTACTSDHSPMVLSGDIQRQLGGMFRFDNYLALSPEFIPSVQQVWQHNIIGTPMYAVTRKLKALKPIFREQRRKKGDLSHNVQLAKGFLEMAQVLVTSNRQDELFLQLEHCCRVVLTKAAKLEQIMLQ